MVRLVKVQESNSSRLQKVKDDILFYKKCFRKLHRLDSWEDVEKLSKEDDVEYQVQTSMNRRRSKKGDDFDTAMDEVEEMFFALMNQYDMDKEIKKDQARQDARKALYRLKEFYNVIEETQTTVFVEPPEDAKQKDLVQFVDKVADLCNAKYYGTGRGGSWTTFDLLSKDGAVIKAGWTKDDKWEAYVENL